MMSGTCHCHPCRFCTSGHTVRRISAGVSRHSLPARCPLQCRRGKRLPAPSAMLGMFPKKEKRKIIRCGAPVLRKAAQKVPDEMFGTEELRELVAKMVMAMREAPGVGLAAPQIGVSLQVIVLEDKPAYIRGMPPGKAEQMQRKPFELLVLCNPRLKPVGQAGARFYEGCLSVPGYQAVVDRYDTVEVEGLTPDGQPLQFKATGWQARIFQHEFDHIRGVVYVDRMHSRTFVHQSVTAAQASEFAMPLGPCTCMHALE